MPYCAWVQQAELPIRLGGCGNRSCSRTSHTAYWASWADLVRGLCRRYPGIGSPMLHHLTVTQAARFPTVLPRYMLQVELAGTFFKANGWNSRPAWVDLAAGPRPPVPNPTEVVLGEWRHGWQYHASRGLENEAQSQLKQLLALPSTRRNTACAGNARLLSCTGRFSSSWTAVAPRTDALAFGNHELLIAMRRWPGVAISCKGPDAHGHASFATNVGARMNARHTEYNAGWKQVLVEAGGHMPSRNEGRVLRNTCVPVDPLDSRRLDLVVPGLNVAQGLASFCDGTVAPPLPAAGWTRPGTNINASGLLVEATRRNNQTYHEVTDSDLKSLFCLGAEGFGRLSTQSVTLLPELARTRSRGLHPRFRRGIA
jgi:hypothetical protein